MEGETQPLAAMPASWPVFGVTAVDQIAGLLAVRGCLEVAGDACQDELMLLEPGRPDGLTLDHYPDICSDLLDRGVTVRIISQHRNRAELATRLKIKCLVETGALVRTVSHVPRAAMVFDRSLAVLFESSNGDTLASRVRNGAVVRFLLDIFDHLWDAAIPFDRFESGYAEVTDDLLQTIASLMANGLTDEAMARRLGMSVRTCRRHIAALMQSLDAVSRFQAGAQAARCSLVVSA